MTSLRPSLVTEIVEEADSIGDILSGTEVVLGPALENETFPTGMPNSGVARVRALLGLEDQTTADIVVALVFPDGVPDDVDASEVLRALRAAAHRERAALRDASRDASDALPDRARRLVGLWAVATARHAAAARSVDTLAAVLIEALADRWRALAASMSESPSETA